MTVERPLLAGYTLGNSKRAEEKRAAYIGGLVYINQMSSFRERITLGAHIRNLNIPSRVTQEGFIEDILSELDMGTLINVRLSHGDFKDGNILVNQENNTVNLTYNFDLGDIAKSKGFLLVSSSPLTRSSYHADEDFAKLQQNRLKNN